MKKIILTLAIATLLIAGCTSQDTLEEIPDSSVFEMKSFGAFSPQDQVVTLVTVTPEKVNYKTFDTEGDVTRNMEQEITSEQYNQLLNAFGDADFKNVNSQIEPEANIADVGEVNITLRYDGYEKTVNIDPFYTPELSDELNTVIDHFSALSMQARDLNSDEAEMMAEDWIKNAPTYAYDGSDLTLDSHVVMESYPTQHVLTYNFTSAHGGYGDRSDQMVTQVITPHQITLRIIDGGIQSAVIDEEWDELNQKPVTPESVQMVYQPMQCQTTPWRQWYEDGNIQFVTEPTDEQLISAYYSDKGAEVETVSQKQREGAVCQACDVCPSTTYYEVTVGDGASMLEEDGWETI